MKNANDYILNLKPSVLDERDLLLENIYPEKVSLPNKWDLRKQLLNVRDQGQEGTCSAQVAATMKEWQEFGDVGINEYMSPWFVYQLRQNYGEYGMTPRDTMKILNKTGIVREKEYPYLTSRPISDRNIQNAGMFRINAYARVNTLESLKKAIFANGPCYIAFPVYNANKMEFWKPDSPRQRMLGGHACFTKDTTVLLSDGRNLDFEQLIKEFKNKSFNVYSVDKNSNIVVGTAHSPRLTRENVKIIKVTLNSGDIIKCTEDHKFLLKNNTYKEAKDLNENDELMSISQFLKNTKYKINNDIYDVFRIKTIDFFGYDNVYDITVDEYHNFAIPPGIFVHNCTVVGYNEREFFVRNSWGTDWGSGGHCFYPFEDFGMHWEIWTTLDMDSNQSIMNQKISFSESHQTFFRRLFSRNLKNK